MVFVLSSEVDLFGDNERTEAVCSEVELIQ